MPDSVMSRIQAGELRSLAARIFEALAVPPGEAAWVAELLVRANLVGHDSHGVMRIPQYARAIRAGLVQPAPAPGSSRSPPPRRSSTVTGG